MSDTKLEGRGKNIKPLISELYSEEEKYWDSIDSRKSDLGEDREYILKQAISQQQESKTLALAPNTPVHAKDEQVRMTSSGTHPTIDNYKFTYIVEHLATLHYPEGKPQTPDESIKRVKELIVSGSVYSQEVLLGISSDYLTICQADNKETLNSFPLSHISKVFSVAKKKNFPSVLIIHSHDARGSRPFIHIFQSEKISPHEIRDNLLSVVSRRFSTEMSHTQTMDPIQEKSDSDAESEDQISPTPTRKRVSLWSKMAMRPSTKSQARMFETKGEIGSHNINAPKPAPGHNIAKGAAEVNQQRNKAIAIQKDIDLLNASLDDIELVADTVDIYKASQNKKSKKKKMRKKSQDEPKPPDRSELIDAFQKTRYAVNLLSKLGHHLRNPSSIEILNLMLETIKGLSDFTGGTKLISSITVPLLTERSIRLLNRGLQRETKVFWNSLGSNWILTQGNWPVGKSVPDYSPVFRNGHTPDTLPQNEPIIWGNLEPLKQEDRPLDYSDAYDYYQVAVSAASEMIPKGLDTAINEQAKIIKNRSAEESQGSLTSSKPSVNQHHKTSSISGAQQLQSNQILLPQDYTRTSHDQLSVVRGEVIDVLERRGDMLLVRNSGSEQGFIPIRITQTSANSSVQVQNSSLLPHQVQQILTTPIDKRRDSGRRNSTQGISSPASLIGEVPDFDPTPIPLPPIPDPPPDIPPGWPNEKVINQLSPKSSRAKTKQQDLFEGGGMNIIHDLRSREPLRQTNAAKKHSYQKDVSEELENKLKKLIVQVTESKPNQELRISAMSTKEEVIQWLEQHSFLIAKDKLRGINGQQLFGISKEDLRDICGFGEATRLFSQLQKSNDANTPETQFQRVMRIKKDDIDQRTPVIAAGGVPKWLKEHRDKISGKSNEITDQEPQGETSVWEKRQADKAKREKETRQLAREQIWKRRKDARDNEERDEREKEIRNSRILQEEKDKPIRRKSRRHEKKKKKSSEEKVEKKKTKISEKSGNTRRSKKTTKKNRNDDEKKRKRKSKRESTTGSESADNDSEVGSNLSESDEYDSDSSESSTESSEEEVTKKEEKSTDTNADATSDPQMRPGMYQYGSHQSGYPSRFSSPYSPPHMGIGIGYPDLLTQQYIHQQQVAKAENERFNAELKLRHLQSQGPLGPVFGGMASPGNRLLGAGPYPYAPTLDGNYMTMI